MNRIYTLLGALAVTGVLLGAVYYKGTIDGSTSEQAAQQEAIDELNEALRKKQAELAALEAQRLAEMEALDEEVDELRRLANEAPDADRPAISVGSVQRLNTVR